MVDRDFGDLSIKIIPIPEDGCYDIKDVDAGDLNYQKRIRYKQDTSYRKYLAIWMMIVVSFWLLLVILFVAFNKPWCLFISDNVLVTLLATTTVNVLGLANIVLKGLFHTATYPLNFKKNKKQK